MDRLAHPMRNLLAAALPAALLAALPAAAATLHVDAANAAGAQDGTQAAPFASIQVALDAAAPGDVVSVAPGIYYENVTLKDQVALVSQRGPASTIVDGRGGYVIGSWFQQGPVRATVDGFTIRNGSTLVHGVSGWGTGYTQITVRNCVLRDGGLGVRASIQSSFVFERVVFYNTQQAVSSIWGSGPTLKNVVIDRADQAIWSYQTGVWIWNSVLANARVLLSGPMVGPESAYIKGYFNGGHNDLFAYQAFSEGNAVSFLSDSLGVDPMFVGAPDDYRLKTGSPLVDAGVDVGLPFYGSAPDVGAFEWEPSDPVELLSGLAVSVRDAPPATFPSLEDERRNALYNQLMAALRMFEAVRADGPAAEREATLAGAAAMLRHAVLAKADGHHGGNPANDWIVSREEQEQFYPRVKELLDVIEAQLQPRP